MTRELRRRADDDHDVIIVGGGHNGLVTAGYLARAGLDVHVVEARAQVGGTAASEMFRGASVNICNCDHITFRTTTVAADLDLQAHGLEYIDVEPGMHATVWGDDRIWSHSHSVEATLESIAAACPGQVQAYRAFADAARPVVDMILAAAVEPPTVRSLTGVAARRRLRGIRSLFGWSRMSAEAVLRRFFDDELILAPALAIGPMVWGVAPRSTGTGLGAMALAMRHAGQVGRPRGGSGALTEALASAVRVRGGRITNGVAVSAVDCDADGVRGVTLTNGSQLRAPVVVSATDPRRTFVDWLSPPPPSAAIAIERWRLVQGADGYESKVDAVLSRAPAVRSIGAVTGSSVVIAPTTDDIDRGAAMLAAGTVLDRPALFLNTPSVLDETLAPAGQHVFSLECLYTPYRFAPGWTDRTEPQRWLDLAATVYEDDFADLVVAWRAVTPDVYEREFHLPAGHADSFAGGPLAALRNTHPELTRYETSVSGLYLTGAATFPGAGIWGASGRNCATVILDKVGSRLTA